MAYKTIEFTYTGKIGKNYGIDGSAIVKEGIEWTPENVKDNKICEIWVKEGLAKYKGSENPQPKYEDVEKEVLDKEFKEEVGIDLDPVKKENDTKPKKRGRKPKNK